jgi:hypothetical protein
MGHYARIHGLTHTVEQVIVAEFDFIKTLPDRDFWIQTSYNTRGGIHYQPNSNKPSEDQSKALRKNFAGIGYTYDAQRDAFIPPKPYASWVLNEDTCLWDAPVAMPTDGGMYQWDESTTSWVALEQEQP